jgi:hypothetical protein
MDAAEYERRARENVAACEKELGKLPEKDEMAVGIMVYRQMRAEEQAKKEAADAR